MQNVALEASKNLKELQKNPYPGRGFIVGKFTDEHVVQVYWLMGRSENSRNRRLAHNGDIVRAEAADPSKVSNPSLIMYNVMREGLFTHVVSNGDQTDTITEGNGTDNFEMAMRRREYEPDEPHYTARISSASSVFASGVCTRIGVLSRSALGRCDRTTYLYDTLPTGYGFCMHTYAGDGNPLPTFRGPPFILPLNGDIHRVSKFYWNVLNKDNRVALVTKFIHIESGRSRVHIINRF